MVSRSLGKLRDTIASQVPHAATSLGAIDHLLSALRSDFELALDSIPGPKRTLESNSQTLQDEIRALQKALQYQKTVRAKLEEDALSYQGRIANRIQHIWMIRAGLAPPTIPVRTIGDFLWRLFSQ